MNFSIGIYSLPLVGLLPEEAPLLKEEEERPKALHLLEEVALLSPAVMRSFRLN